MTAKQSKADFLRSWGITDPNKIKASFSWLRYKSPPEKGIYWYYFSLMVRQRDVEEYGTCISCGRPITLDNCDAGHFMPAADCGRDLLFDPLNVHAECSHCNAWDSTHLLGYAENLDKRYGPGTALGLRARRQAYKDGPTVKDWKAAEYAEKIRALPSYPHQLSR
jgi:5-methylcytosine-specific restriction endonuclease McrA